MKVVQFIVSNIRLSGMIPIAIPPALFFRPEDELRASIIAIGEARRRFNSSDRLWLLHHPHWGLKQTPREQIYKTQKAKHQLVSNHLKHSFDQYCTKTSTYTVATVTTGLTALYPVPKIFLPLGGGSRG